MTNLADRVEDARAQRDGICRVTRMVGATEFICIARAHDDPPAPPFYDGGPECHYFVNRWPYRGGNT